MMRRTASTILIGGALLLTGGASASELALQGYAGYAGVDTDEDFECVSRACSGVLDDTLFYGLSIGFQEGFLGGQLIVSQDVDEDPRVSLAQLSVTHTSEKLQASARAGRIIVPLGLYGTHRITPNTRPGLVLPQSFLLNSFYDILTLSEEGVAGELRTGAWTFKAAAYEPDEETIEVIFEEPGGLLPVPPDGGSVLGTLVDTLVFLLFGPSDPPVPGQPGNQVVTSKRTSRGYFGGVAYENDGLRADLGYTDLDLFGLDFRSLSGGVEYAFGAWQPSLEVFELDVGGGGDAVRGGSATLVYNGNSWQLFANAVQIETDDTEARELVFGGAYYWNNWAAKLARHDIDTEFVQVSAEDSIGSTVLSLAYSFN